MTQNSKSILLLLLPSIILSDAAQPHPRVHSAIPHKTEHDLNYETLFCSGSVTDYQPCNTDVCIDYDAPAPVDGEWSDWSDWGICTCDGLQKRHRQIYRHAQFGGKFPSGPAVQSRQCFPSCKQDLPVNCELSEWGEWTKCSKPCGVGTQTRERRITTHTLNCGKTCNDVALVESRSCNTENCGEIVNCELSEWSYWSDCDKECDGGQTYRTRSIAQSAENGGLSCDDASLEEVRGCNLECCSEHAPVDCVWGEWESWGDCSKKCGGGERQRQRHIATSPRNGGKLCDARTLVEVEECNSHSCNYAAPVDAVWGEWSWWSSCTKDCGGGYQFRSRSVASPARNGGVGVVGDFQEFRECNLEECVTYPVDCSYSEWSYWSDCSCSCNGHQSRSRSISQFAQNGGKECEGSLREVTSCNVNTAECEANKAEDCLLSEWSDWGSCSNSCDGGQTVRSRHILKPARHHGKPCSDELDQVRPCNLQPCCPECSADRDCQWGEWHDWSACSADCGGGQQTRYREITTQPKNGGFACDANDSVEIRGCNEHLCGSVEYCVWSEWSDYGYCSKECGGGYQTRKKHLYKTTSTPYNTRDIVSSSRQSSEGTDDENGGWFGLDEVAQKASDDEKDKNEDNQSSGLTDEAKKKATKELKKNFEKAKAKAHKHLSSFWTHVKSWFGLSEDKTIENTNEEKKEEEKEKSLTDKGKEYAKKNAKKHWEIAKRKAKAHLSSFWGKVKSWFGLSEVGSIEPSTTSYAENNEDEENAIMQTEFFNFGIFCMMILTTVGLTMVVWRRFVSVDDQNSRGGEQSSYHAVGGVEFIE